MFEFSKIKIAFICFISALCLLIAAGNFVDLGKISNHKVNLGLDLQGGSHLLLEVDYNYYIKEQILNTIDELKAEFRKERIRAIPKMRVEKKENRENYIIYFSLKDNADTKKVKNIVKNIDKNLNVSVNGNNFSILYTDTAINEIESRLLKQSIEIVRKRIDETGTKEPIIQAQGKNRILVQVAGMTNPDELKKTLGKTAKMTFHFVDMNAKPNAAGLLPPDIIKMKQMNGDYEYPVNRKVILSGDLLIDANATYFEGKPAVSFKFNSLGAKKFAEITKSNIGSIFAIVLDNEVITAPRINIPITTGDGVITGSFDVDEANRVALLLRAGALPAPLEVIEERSVGPSLGQDSIEKGINASVVGLFAVIIFMILVYKLFGIFADIALIVNMSIILSILSLIGATLTLPGIAGLVLTIGMAVDANVLIFERIKEESKGGRSPHSAIETGFNIAFKTILDSNITTLIIAFTLYTFGTGAIRGFATVLAIGIISSMFTAIMVCKLMIWSWFKVKRPENIDSKFII